VTRHLHRSPRVLAVALLSALAAAFAGYLTLAHGSSPAVDSVTPIKHVVVIFDENESFDHYFATYPNATNPAGEPAFTAAPGTPSVDGLSGGLLGASNPNSEKPARIDRPNALTCDQNHSYAPEQQAFDGGAMDRFPEYTGGACHLVMGYFDGNTVTGLWNLAQHFTLNDNYYGSAFGPSTPGALNLIAGNTRTALPAGTSGITDGAMVGDPDPALDDCGSGPAQVTGQNIGDLMNTAGVTWGWFQGGFRPTTAWSGSGRAACATSHRNIGGATITDYSAHHEPFMYFSSTANPHHLPPTSVANIGRSDQANHQYDLTDFDAAVKADDLPQVSFLKAAQAEDGHPGNSDPLDEQAWIARVVDEVQQSPDWSSTAIVITYDDSDGWYDHEDVVSQGSNNGTDTAMCTGAAGSGDANYSGRCGPGPRLPLLVVSPWSRRANSVDHTQLEQASIIHFIEDNWNLGRIGNQSFDTRAATLTSMFDFAPGDARAAKVFLDPSTGQVVGSAPCGVATSPGASGCTTTPPATTPVTTPVVTPPVSTTPPVVTTPTRPPVTTPPARPSTRLAIRLSALKGRRSGKKLTLTFRFSGIASARGRLTGSVKLSSKGKTVATAATKTIRSGRASFTLKARKAIKKGRYTLTLRFRQGSLSATVTRTITIK
jgi:phospholipase C